MYFTFGTLCESKNRLLTKSGDEENKTLRTIFRRESVLLVTRRRPFND